MDLPSMIAGASGAAAIIGTALVPLLRRRDDRRVSLRQEAAEERSRRLAAEEASDKLRDALVGTEESARRAVIAQAEIARLESALRAEKAARAATVVLGRALVEPLGPVTEVFNASRDLWMIVQPDGAGDVLLAMGPWERIGIKREDLLGGGWRNQLSPNSRRAADRAEAAALAGAGRAALWYMGKAVDGRLGEYCLRWNYGRYNGALLAVAQVVAYRPRG